MSSTRIIAAIGAGSAVAVASCGSADTRTTSAQPLTITAMTFLHTGYAAGPAVFTDGAGNLLEERRYEPFGAPIDARVRRGSTYVVEEPDVRARDLNALNKRTDSASGWSDHGARWMAPETGRWLSTDPPVAGPKVEQMLAPWDLHPYQYVAQNPIAYWDPDGRDKKGTFYVFDLADDAKDTMNEPSIIEAFVQFAEDEFGEPRAEVRDLARAGYDVKWLTHVTKADFKNYISDPATVGFILDAHGSEGSIHFSDRVMYGSGFAELTRGLNLKMGVFVVCELGMARKSLEAQLPGVNLYGLTSEVTGWHKSALTGDLSEALESNLGVTPRVDDPYFNKVLSVIDDLF